MLDALNPAAAGLVPLIPQPAALFRVGDTLMLLCKVAIEMITEVGK
jgi:hypothetical protein